MNDNYVGYIRVSTTEQARSGISIPDQEQRIRDYVQFAGGNLIKVYRDPGVSASVKLDDRPGGSELIRELENGVDNIVAVKLDRLFRDVDDCRKYVMDWDTRGKALHLIDFGGTVLNTKTAIGKAFITVVATFAELERGLARERIQSAHERLAINGKWHGGPLPMGYQYDDDNNVLVNESEAAVVKEIFKLRYAGNSADKIAHMLAEKGYRSRHGNKRITPITIKRILENRTYISERDFNGNIYSLDIPPLIDRETWDTVQAIATKSHGGARNRYLLSGMLRCGLCEGSMIHANYKERGYAEYICKGRKVWKDCKGVGIREKKAQSFVLEKFFERVEESYQETAPKTAKRHATIEKSVSGIKQKLNVIERKQDNLFHQQAEGHLDPAQWERLNRDLSEQAEVLRIEIARANADKALSPTYEGDIREDWERMTLDERRHALGLFVERVIIKPGRGSDRIEIVWRD